MTCEHQEKWRKENPICSLSRKKSPNEMLNIVFNSSFCDNVIKVLRLLYFFKCFILFIFSVNVCDVLRGGTSVEVTRQLCGVDSHLLHFCKF